MGIFVRLYLLAYQSQFSQVFRVSVVVSLVIRVTAIEGNNNDNNNNR